MKSPLALQTPSQGAKIFVVDDTFSNLDVLRFYLEQEGHQVAFANTGERALQLIPKWQPQLILLDIMMIPMDGFEVCRRLKENESTAQIPIIFISALTSSDDLARGFREGGVDYLTKPLSRQEVLIKVKTQLERLHYRQSLLHLQQGLLTCSEYLLKSEPVAVLQLDAQASILACNAHAEQFLQLGVITFPITFDTWSHIFASQEQATLTQYWQQSLHLNQPQAFQLTTHTGQKFELHMFPLSLETHENVRLIVGLHHQAG